MNLETEPDLFPCPECGRTIRGDTELCRRCGVQLPPWKLTGLLLDTGVRLSEAPPLWLIWFYSLELDELGAKVDWWAEVRAFLASIAGRPDEEREAMFLAFQKRANRWALEAYVDFRRNGREHPEHGDYGYRLTIECGVKLEIRDGCYDEAIALCRFAQSIGLYGHWEEMIAEVREHEREAAELDRLIDR